MTNININDYVNPDNIYIETGTTADGKKKGTSLKKYLNKDIKITDDGQPQKIGFKIGNKDVYCIYKNLGLLTNNVAKTFDIGVTLLNVRPILMQLNGSARWGTNVGMEKPYPSGICEVSLRNDGLLVEPQADLSTSTGYLFMLFIYL